jgi:hypothetical protein
MQTDDQPPSQEHPQDRLRSAEEECERLREENVRLRAMLGIPELVGGVNTLHPGSDREDSAKAHGPSTPEKKIILFRGLFRGREDPVSQRWLGLQKVDIVASHIASIICQTSLPVKPTWSALTFAKRQPKMAIPRKLTRDVLSTPSC